jgi:hypothetical protein
MKPESPDISFEKGINQDVHPSQIPQGQYFEAEGVMISSDEGDHGNTFALNNERGFTEYSDFIDKKPNHLIMGMFPYGDRIVVFSIAYSVLGSVITTTESEIGYIRDEIYTEVINDTDVIKNPTLSESFNFDIRYPIDVRFKPNYKNELVVYWTDIGLNPPRFLNLDLDYTLTNNVFNNLSQQTTVFETIDSPVVTYISTIEGGNVKPGLYHFAVRYLNKTLDPTTFGLLCNGIPVVDDNRKASRLFYDGADYESTNTSKSLELEITNIDQDFFYIEIAVLTYVGAASTPSAFLIKRERVKGSSSIRIIFDGRVGESIAFGLLTESKPIYDTAKHIETKDNRLLLSNLSLNGQLNLQPIANAIRLKYAIEEIDYDEDYCLTDTGGLAHSDGGNAEYGLSNFDSDETSYPENYEAGGGFDDYKNEELTFNQKGWSRDECYSLAIVGILKVGGFTEAFHIPGFYDSDTLGMPDPGEYDNNGNIYAGIGAVDGYLNCFVSEDRYDDPDNLYYFDNGGTTLHNEYIRHHLFPTHAQEPHYRYDAGSIIRPMGIRIEGLAAALAANPDLDSKLAGIILVREQRNTFSNRRVYAMGFLNRMSYWDGSAQEYLATTGKFDVKNPIYTINPLFGDTVTEATRTTFAVPFYGRNYPLNPEAIKSCAWYSPESILTKDFNVPVSARIINIARLDADLKQCMTGSPTKDHETPNYTAGSESAYGTKTITGWVAGTGGIANSITFTEFPFIEDWENPFAGRFNYGTYDVDSETGKLPRGFKFYLFADFNREPIIWYTDNVDPVYPLTYNQSNGIRVGMSIKRTYNTEWNSDKHTAQGITELDHLVGEKYKLNNYGNEGFLVIECGEQINVPFDNSQGMVSDLGTVIGLVSGFGPYPGIKDYLHQDNIDINPEFYSIRLNIGLKNISGTATPQVNDNDFMIYTYDGDGRPMTLRDLYILKNVVKNQYKQLDGNEYIIVDTLLRDDQARDSDELNVAETRTIWNGDVFISKFFFKTSLTIPYGFYDYQATPPIWSADYPGWAVDKLLEVYGPMAPELQDRKGGVLKAGNYYFVESEINCNYRHFPVQRDEQGNIIAHGVPYFPKQNKHKVLSPDAELGQSDGYNIAYSHENDLRKFFLRPFGFEDVIEYPDRTIASEQQFEGEASDQFRNFFFNTYQDIPKNNGEITSLFVHRNTLYAHVERSLYRMFFNETAIIPSSSQDILLGNAGVFSRLAEEVYVVNNNGTHAGYCGSIHKFANVNTPYGRIIVDYYQKKVFLFTDTISEISQNGLWKWWKNNMIFTGTDPANPNYIVDHINPFGAGILTIFDPNYKRVIIVFREGEEFKCRSFGLINNAWISLHPYDPHVACVLDNKIISTRNDLNIVDPVKLKLALHDSGAHGLYYNQEELEESSITFIARPTPATDKTPDNFEVFVEFYDHSSNRLVKPEFFDIMEFWNDHQYTGQHQVVLEDPNNQFNINVVRSQNHYNLKTPLSITVNESADIFDAGNQDINLEDKPRMRGQYLYGKFTYNNDGNLHFVLQYIFSSFRISRR